jgi:hypothetical protein
MTTTNPLGSLGVNLVISTALPSSSLTIAQFGHLFTRLFINNLFPISLFPLGTNWLNYLLFIPWPGRISDGLAIDKMKKLGSGEKNFF